MKGYCPCAEHSVGDSGQRELLQQTCSFTLRTADNGKTALILTLGQRGALISPECHLM